MYNCIAFSFICCLTFGQNVPFVGCGIFVFVTPLSTARASSALVFISSSRSLLVQNHISSGVAFSMYCTPFWISWVVFALFIRATARPIL